MPGIGRRVKNGVWKRLPGGGQSVVTPYSLKGVQYAAYRFVRYKLGEIPVIHGWVYGFSELYQIFIIYMVLEKGGYEDLKDIIKILGTFEMMISKNK